MSEEGLIAFTDNYADNSSEAGFQFTFFCDICQEGYKTRFIESETAKKGGFIEGLGKAASALGRVTGEYDVGYGIESGTDILSEKYSDKSPEWREEYEEAFEKAQNEAKGHFNRCPNCTHWVCDNCWNEQVGLCIECGPREGVEKAAARSEKMVDDIKEQAEKTEVFTGEVDAGETTCPKCGKPAGQGDFCNNCGASLELNECPKCGAENSLDSNFCGECGTSLME